MMPFGERPPGHACVTLNCGHPETDHVPTPELASAAETVVWCVSCRRHEVHRPRRFRMPWTRAEPARAHRQLSRPT